MAEKFRSLSFNLKALETFQVVFNELSMTLSARQLGMTQSAVTQTVNKLETELGVTLFNRLRPLQPTPAARELMTRSKTFFSGDSIAILDQNVEF